MLRHNQNIPCPMESQRVFIYVQHLMGSGHAHRAAAISRALVAQGADVCFVSGGFPIPGLNPGTLIQQLPPARAADLSYKSLEAENGAPVDETWRTRRCAQLLKLYQVFRPHGVLLETFPFGRRLMRFELLPLLDAVGRSQPRPLRASSIRDILERWRTPGRNEEIAGLAKRHLDLVLVHGDGNLTPFEDSFPGAGALKACVRYTGYVVDEPEGMLESDAGSGEILVSSGGGKVGEALLAAALAARPLAQKATGTWRLLAGHELPASAFQRLQRDAPEGVTVERNRSDFSVLLRNCAVSVSQAGYHAVAESLTARASSVLVPFADGGRRERSTRAEIFAARGWVSVLPP
ncbi:MAG: glycosyl transferase, partial [Gammaproteobacteria bacterium]